MGRRRMSKQEKIDGIVSRYGIKILDDFETLRTLPYSTLSGMAEKYGITRERIRQLFKIVYGRPYTQSLRKKRAFAKEESAMSCTHNPRHKVSEYVIGSLVHTGAIYEKKFLEQCESKGFCVRPILKRVVDLRVNGHLVDVKYCSTPVRTTKSSNNLYYRYHVLKHQVELCDFFACYHQGEEYFYIIPNVFFTTKKCDTMIYIPEKHPHRYSEYKNAWHLLA